MFDFFGEGGENWVVKGCGIYKPLGLESWGRVPVSLPFDIFISSRSVMNSTEPLQQSQRTQLEKLFQ